MVPMSRLALLSIVATLAAATAIGVAPEGSAAPTDLPGPAGFASRVDNPWFPLRPGVTYVYRGVKDGLPSRDVFTVTASTKTIQGVSCTVVRDRLYLRKRLRERTEDWYAQDVAGNVWYFGEATAELGPGGKVRSTEGSWRSGVDGARAGIFMPAHPHAGQSGQQEIYPGHAEDRFRVLSLAAGVDTPAVRSDRALLTREWTPLEPGVVDHKLYVKGIGTALEETVRGGDELNELVAIRR
jgi:hypothetical protein